MATCGFTENVGTYRNLLAAYSEKHRAYHTLDHIHACLVHLEAVANIARHPHEIALALWFHDAVYHPFSNTNEDDSAKMVGKFLDVNACAADVTVRVCELIHITKDHVSPQTIDAQLMLDIDLSILGANRNVYADFEANIRREYKRVPTFIFKRKRKEILKGFLNRARLYQASYFYDQFEDQAKCNLEWAIAEL